MATNNFLPFCPTDTGTNLLSQGDYAVAADRTSGNQPGVASSKLVNKALRQASYIASQLAQFAGNRTGADTLDNGNANQLLGIIAAALTPLPLTYTKYTSGSGTHNLTHYFFIASGNATTGATYTNNGATFTVKTTIASGVLLACTGTGFPAISGTLTKTGGTGDNTITFYAARSPISLNVQVLGGGGGGSGSGSSGGGNGGNGGSSSFGTALIACGGGIGGLFNTGSVSAGGTASLGTGPVGIVVPGGYGPKNTAVPSTGNSSGAPGAPGPWSGAGSGGYTSGGTGDAAAANSGAGGGGGGSGSVSVLMGAGGASGGFVDAIITTVLAQYAYVVGAAGVQGTAGSSGVAGGPGGSGLVTVQENYQ